MTDEQAFLDALRANPADDTTRLVYADWLDEHGAPAKAEYLRLVVGLVPQYQVANPDPPEAARVQALASGLPREWRATAAARFSVVLYHCDPAQKINTIKLVREVTGFGLAEAKRFVESPPARVPTRLTLEDATALRDRMRTGAAARVEVHPSDGADLPHVVVYSVEAELISIGRYTDIHDRPPAEGLEVFRQFLVVALGVTVERAAELADQLWVVLADDIEPSELPTRLAVWEKLLPDMNTAAERSWEIFLHPTYRVTPLPPHS